MAQNGLRGDRIIARRPPTDLVVVPGPWRLGAITGLARHIRGLRRPDDKCYPIGPSLTSVPV